MITSIEIEDAPVAQKVAFVTPLFLDTMFILPPPLKPRMVARVITHETIHLVLYKLGEREEFLKLDNID